MAQEEPHVRCTPCSRATLSDDDMTRKVTSALLSGDGADTRHGSMSRASSMVSDLKPVSKASVAWAWGVVAPHSHHGLNAGAAK